MGSARYALARPRGAEPIVGVRTARDDVAMDGVFVVFLAIDAIPWSSGS